MLKKNNFILENLTCTSKIIKKRHTDDETPVVEIILDTVDGTCYIKSIGTNLQDNIVDFDEYKDFIYLVDEAYYELSAIGKWVVNKN